MACIHYCDSQLGDNVHTKKKVTTNILMECPMLIKLNL